MEKKYLYLSSLAFLMVTTPLMAETPAREPTLDVAIQAYLAQDCGSGERAPARYQNIILKQSDKALSILSTALLTGPDRKLKTLFNKQVEQDYQKLRKHLDNGGLSRLENKDVLKAAMQLDKEKYLARREQEYQRVYQERALQILAKINSGASKKVIEKFVASPNQDQQLLSTAKKLLR